MKKEQKLLQESPKKKWLSSSLRTEEKKSASSQRGQPQLKKEDDIWAKGRRITKDEHVEFIKFFDDDGKPIIKILGRPKKQPEEK